ncbi:dispersed gene family protein 1 (DGF-1) [Trypanosoma cruzi]|nr:dispersed gene family protein 1 (DGF-1) [Trypanosoma cruzi]
MDDAASACAVRLTPSPRFFTLARGGVVRHPPVGGCHSQYLCMEAVVLAVTTYCMVLWYVEDCDWQELREPRRGGLEALLRDGEDGAEETQKSYDMTSSSYASGKHCFVVVPNTCTAVAPYGW